MRQGWRDSDHRFPARPSFARGNLTTRIRNLTRIRYSQLFTSAERGAQTSSIREIWLWASQNSAAASPEAAESGRQRIPSGSTDTIRTFSSYLSKNTFTTDPTLTAA